ncbi:MAG: pantoate--beta-alanine ligase [Thermoleophilia bacterium]|nr:pantoate--beta-alanine ligase [Thermoleophilia bacterium]
MRVITTAAEVRHQVEVAHGRGDRVGLVTTRGDLHDGHAAIIRTAHAQCDLVLCTIVRPDGSPAFHEAADEAVARGAGAHLLWRPAPGPLVARASVQVVPTRNPELAPLATAAAQQLGIARPDVAYAGEEHFDHARLLRDVARDLLLDVEVRTVPTPRDPDGLPLGVATRTLDASGRDAARAVPEALDLVARSVADGEHSLFRLRARAEARLADAGAALDVEDVATVDPASFEPVDVFDQPVLLVVRARVGDVALVDSRMLVRDAVST